MSTSLLYHRFGIVGYRYVRQSFEAGITIFRIGRKRGREEKGVGSWVGSLF